MIKKILYVGICALAVQFSSAFAATQPATANAKIDGQIMSWLVTVDNNEINAAKIALKKKPDAQVKNYAEMMISDHSKNLHKTMALSQVTHEKLVKGDEANAMTKAGKDTAKKLTAANGLEFEKTYIDAMVNGHTAVLGQIDKFMSDDTNMNAQLADHLKSTRATVEHHLSAAKDVQKSLSDTTQASE